MTEKDKKIFSETMFEKRKRNELLNQLIEESLSNEETYSTKANKNLALFLAKKDEINEVLAEGWNIKSVWKILNKKGAFPGCYDSFLRYVKKYLFYEKENNTNLYDIKNNKEQNNDNGNDKEVLYQNKINKCSTTKCFNPPKKISPDDLY